MKTYAQANKPKEGWKNADDESMCATVAQQIAIYCCLNPARVYNWIRKHYGTDYKTVKVMRGNDSIPYFHLVERILWDTKPDEK